LPDILPFNPNIFTVFSQRLFEKCTQGAMPWRIGLDLIPAAGLFNILTYFQ
jgi:hypothetical protein